jgi:hypothetical protein
MNSKKAIEILKKQKEYLINTPSEKINELWLIQTEYYFRKFFKEESWQVRLITSYKFPLITEENFDTRFIVIKQRLVMFLDNSIQVIEDVGIEIPYKNFLSRLSDGWLIAILTFTTVTSFSLGGWVYTHYYQSPINYNNCKPQK